MDRISLIIPKVLGKRGLQGPARAAMTVHRAQEWIAKHLPAFATDLRVVKVEDGILCIEATTSVAAQECRQLSVQLRAFLQGSPENVLLEDVRILRAGSAQASYGH